MVFKQFKNKLFFILLTCSVCISTSVYSEEQNGKPLEGEILLPDDYNKSEEKKCITVCKEWGEDCIINPRTGSRKCRRVCKSFTEECFREQDQY